MRPPIYHLYQTIPPPAEAPAQLQDTKCNAALYPIIEEDNDLEDKDLDMPHEGKEREMMLFEDVRTSVQIRGSPKSS